MRQPRLAPLFVAVLAVGSVVAMTMIVMLVWFVSAQGEAGTWESLVTALSAAAAALAVILLLHITLTAAGRGVDARRQSATAEWARRWSEVSAGGDVPDVPSDARDVAAEAAAQILTHLDGEGARLVRRALKSSGLLASELIAATRGLGAPRSRATAVVERLAWIAMPEAMPVFRRAANCRDERAATAAVLGATRVLADQPDPEELGPEVVATIEDYVRAASIPAGTGSFLAAALTSSGDHLPWLCRTLLRRAEHEAIHIAALDAIGISRRPEAVDLATEALENAMEDETESAALRTLARLGSVPASAVPTVLAAAEEAHAGTRVQAAYALVWTDLTVALPALWKLLGDMSWEVRQAAAYALQNCGPLGMDALQRASEQHPDRFARDVASIVGVPAPEPSG